MKPLAQNTLIQNRYLIVHLIGKGGMGEVYLAVDQRLGSAVALKRTFFAGDETLGGAFEREARTLARMRHPVLPKVSDHFGENDEQFLVMEHISGDDLAKRLELAQKPFPVSWVLFWADQLLDALSYLHTHEPPIIHRDIKPQNLKLTDENHIILLDFGLSKTSTGQTNISQSGSTGSVVGYTPHYAPMEQIRGIGTSPRSDLYSLSATLYQLMTNVIPVDALSRADSLLNEMPDPIRSPSEINPEIPKAVSEVILKGMEVSQDKRYSDAREMQKVLRKAFNEIQQATTAKTIAFNINDGPAVAIDQPESALASKESASNIPGGVAPPDITASSSVPVSIPQLDEDNPIDLAATMAFDAPFPPSSAKQADVKTEIFLAGGNSLTVPEPQSYENPEPGNEIPTEVPAKKRKEPRVAEGPDGLAATPTNYSPEATIPLILIGGDDETESVVADPESAREPESYGGQDETFSSPATPYFEPPPSEAQDQPKPLANAGQTSSAAAAPKRSSKKVFAIVGGLAALLLLAAAAAAGVWAYMNFGPGRMGADPATASPSPAITPEATPEATLDTAVNSNTGDDSTPGNSNTNVNNEVPSASPTPASTPFGGSSSTPKPTPQIGPKETPVKPLPTPKPVVTPKPKKTPVVSPTILQ